MLFLELLQVAVEQGILSCLKLWVSIENKGCCVASQLNKLPVTTKIGKP